MRKYILSLSQMKCTLWLLLIAIFGVCIIWTFCESSKEEFGDVLGALAPYKDLLYECEKQCEREDPSKRLLSQGNIACDAFCQSVFTDLARHNVPPPPLVTDEDLCEKQCSQGPFANHPLSKDKCISFCRCQREVKAWCREMQCPYTDQDTEECMLGCVKNMETNCVNTSWTWKKHG